jgi:ubiquitin-like protein Pup
MMAKEQKRITKHTPSSEGKDEKINPEVVKKGKKIKEDLDNLLDEIDEVLEENAEEFVKNYVQRGGE